jgi:hypothetical protein
MIGAGDGAFEMAITLGQAGSSVRANVPDGGHLVVVITEEAQLFVQHPEAQRLAAYLAVSKGGVPEVVESRGRR